VDQPTKQLCFGESSEEEVIITRITSGEQRTKKMCLGEYSEEVTITRITSTPAHNKSEDNGLTILQSTKDIITRLPEELLQCIMLKLTYEEISNVRQVCRRFRDNGNNILNRQFRSLKNCVERLLADLVKEENALLPRTSTLTYSLILIRCRGTLNAIRDKLRLLRAVSYRFLLLGDDYSSVFFAGKIIDEVHRILRIVRTRRLPTEGMGLVALRDLVNNWIMFFTHTIEPRLIQQICALNQSTCPDLYGSKIVDLLECLLNSKKFSSVNIDSEGWCYIKGEYNLRRSFFKCREVSNSEVKPLTVPEQINLYEALYYLVKVNNENRLMEAQTDE
jgi:F-box protein 28